MNIFGGRNSLVITTFLAMIIIFSQVFTFDQMVTPINSPLFSPYAHSLSFPHYLGADDTGAMSGDFAFARFVKNSLLNGEVPYWNPFQAIGEPFVGAATGVYYPINLLRLLLPDKWFDVVNIINLLLLALFTGFLCLEYGVNIRYAALAGFIALATTNNLIYMQTNSIGGTITWFPLFILGIEQSSKLKRPWSWSLILIATYGLLNGFHPGAAMASFLFGFFYFLLLFFKLEISKLHYFLNVSIGFLIGLLLSSFQLLPFLHYLLNEVGMSQLSVMDNYHKLATLPQILFPYFFGPLNLTSFGDPTALGHRAQYILLPTTALFVYIFSLYSLFAKNSLKKWIISKEAVLTVLSLIFFLWVFGVPFFTILHSLPGIHRVNMNYALGVVYTIFPVLCAFAVQRVNDINFHPPKILIYGFGLFLLIAPFTIAYYWEVNFFLKDWFLRYTFWGIIFVFFAYIGFVVFLNFRKKDLFLYFLYFSIVLHGIVFFLCIRLDSIHHKLKMGSISLLLALAFYFLIQKIRLLNEHRKTKAWVIGLIVVLGINPFLLPIKNTLPPRVNPFIKPFFVNKLLELQENGMFRSYGIKSYIFPNSAMAIGLSSANILSPMVSLETNQFLKSLDPIQHPIFFYGGINGLASGIAQDPIDMFYNNRSLWNETAVKFLITNPLEKQNILYNKYLPFLFKKIPDIDRSSSKIIPIEFDKLYSGQIVCSDKTLVVAISSQFYSYGLDNLSDLKLDFINLKTKKSQSVTIRGSQILDGKKVQISIPPKICSQKENKLKIQLTSMQKFKNKVGVWVDAKSDALIIHPVNIKLEPNLSEMPKFTKIVAYNKDIDFPIYCTDTKLAGFSMFFSTYAKTYNEKMSLKIWNKDTLLVDVLSENDLIQDNNYVDFLFKKNICVHKGQHLHAKISFPFLPKDEHLALSTDDSGNFRSHFYLKRELPLRVAYNNDEERAIIWENDSAKPRVDLITKWNWVENNSVALNSFLSQKKDYSKNYIARLPTNSSCKEDNDSKSYDFKVKNFHLAPNSLDFKVQSSNSGFILVRDRMAPGWKAFIDGIQVPLYKVNGIFRGICLPRQGEFSISMSYEPTTKKLSTFFVLFGVVFLVLSVLGTLRLKRTLALKES